MRRSRLSAEQVIQLGKLIYQFPILWSGWATDNQGFVYEVPDGRRFIVVTNNGNHVLGSEQFLEKKIEECVAVADAMQFALALFRREDLQDKH